MELAIWPICRFECFRALQLGRRSFPMETYSNRLRSPAWRIMSFAPVTKLNYHRAQRRAVMVIQRRLWRSRGSPAARSCHGAAYPELGQSISQLLSGEVLQCRIEPPNFELEHLKGANGQSRKPTAVQHTRIRHTCRDLGRKPIAQGAVAMIFRTEDRNRVTYDAPIQFGGVAEHVTRFDLDCSQLSSLPQANAALQNRGTV